MLRAVLGAVLGYVVISIVVGAALFAAYAVLGAERSFQPRSYDISTLWLAVVLAVNFVGAILGGVVARKVGRGGGVKALLALMVVLGLAMTAFQAVSESKPPGERNDDVTGLEAFQLAQTPTWVMLAGLGVGILGVLAGAARAGKRTR